MRYMIFKFACVAALGSFGIANCTYAVERAGPEAPAISSRSLGGLDSLLGREVSTRPDGDIGRIVDLLVDADGRVRAAVVEFGGFLGIGTRKIAVDWNAFRIVNGFIAVDVSRDRLREAKDYKANDPGTVVQSSRD